MKFLKLEQVFEMSELRENILKWYPFKENSTVLEIGANTGEITGILTKKCYEVYSIEENKEQREKINQKYLSKENLKILSKMEEMEAGDVCILNSPCAPADVPVVKLVF